MKTLKEFMDTSRHNGPNKKTTYIVYHMHPTDKTKYGSKLISTNKEIDDDEDAKRIFSDKLPAGHVYVSHETREDLKDKVNKIKK